MEKLNNKILIYWLIMAVLIQLNSCQKAPYNPDHRFFLKTFTSDSIHFNSGYFIEQLNDEGFIIISLANNYPLITRTDKYGNLMTQRVVSNSNFNTKGGPLANISTAGDPSHFLAQFGPFLLIFDSSGKVSAKTKAPFSGVPSIYTSNFYFGAVQNGSRFLLPFCDGILGLNTTDKIYEYDGNLNLIKTDSLPDQRLGGHTNSIFLCQGNQSEPFPIFGDKFPRNQWNSYNSSKIFAARVPGIGKVIQTIVDTADQLTSDHYCWQTRSPDSDFVILATRTNVVNKHLNYPLVVKFDNNLNIVWKKTFDVDFGTFTAQNIISCRDAGFLILGSMMRAGYPDPKPYALKIDANGNKEWNKFITSGSGGGELVNGIQLADGGYAFVGDSKQFGKGKNGTQLIFIRTDANGNF